MIYFIRHGADGPVKIGTADNVPARLHTLQAGSPVKLVIVRTTPGGALQEAELHRHYQHLAIHREWFDWCDTMLTIEPSKIAFALAAPKAAERTDKRDPALHAVICKAGGVMRLAEALGVTPPAVTNWRILPARHLPRVAAITGIPARDIRPDLFGASA
jgi:hypothetical protein